MTPPPLPLAPRPYPGEAISSWLRRIAARYDTLADDLARHVLGWAAYWDHPAERLDHRADAVLEAAVARATRVDSISRRSRKCGSFPPMAALRAGIGCGRLGVRHASLSISSIGARSMDRQCGGSAAVCCVPSTPCRSRTAAAVAGRRRRVGFRASKGGCGSLARCLGRCLIRLMGPGPLLTWAGLGIAKSSNSCRYSSGSRTISGARSRHRHRCNPRGWSTPPRA